MNAPDVTERNSAIGAALRRHEDERLLRGEAGFVDDLSLPGMLHAAVLRSPYPHANITDINAEEARNLPGVAAVLTRTELPDPLKPIPIRLCPDEALRAFLQYPLACERVRYAGEPVALVVASSRAVAEDALACIDIDYDPLPACADAAAEPPMALFDSAADNVASLITQSFGDVEAARAQAKRCVRLSFTTGRHSGVPLETRGLLAQYEVSSGRLHIWGATKVTHFNRTVLAGMLGWPEHRIHLAETSVGGGFGVRGEFYPEDFLIPYAALLLRHPVKWVEDRLEHLIATNHSRQQRYELELMLAEDGRFLALKAAVENDMGGYLRTHGTIVPGLSAGMLPGPYRFDAYRCEMKAVLTNKTPTGTYRAPGRFECNAARERLIDQAALQMGMDPVELRRRNLIGPEEMPYRRMTEILGEEVVFDTGDYPKALEQVLELSDFFNRRRAAESATRVRRGLGLACFVEKTGKGPFEGARVRLDPGGDVIVETGAANVGQGLETCLAQIAAAALGVSADCVIVRHSDTDRIDYGVGTFASRATVMAGSAVWEAARALRERLLEQAASWLAVPLQEIDLHHGWLIATDERRHPLRELVACLTPAAVENDEPVLEVTRYFHQDHMTYSHGAIVAEADVDTLTGAVKPQRIWLVCDVGRVVNPRMLAGQIEGGVVQGLGGALLEEFVYDEDGQMFSGSFQDYLLPYVTDAPKISHLCLIDTPSHLNPLGVKGAGEIGIAGVGGALANAVAHALGDAGEQVNCLPMTPERVWSWITRARRASGEYTP